MAGQRHGRRHSCGGPAVTATHRRGVDGPDSVENRGGSAGAVHRCSCRGAGADHQVQADIETLQFPSRANSNEILRGLLLAEASF